MSSSSSYKDCRSFRVAADPTEWLGLKIDPTLKCKWIFDLIPIILSSIPNIDSHRYRKKDLRFVYNGLSQSFRLPYLLFSYLKQQLSSLTERRTQKKAENFLDY
jgi:hypothetical protein